MMAGHIRTTSQRGRGGRGPSAMIRPIRVIRGKLHALSPSLTPQPRQDHRLGDATRMTRKKRMTADHLRSVPFAIP